MGRFNEGSRVERRRLLNEAQRARSRGRHQRAIVLYQAVLEQEPGNLEAQARLAPVLAFAGRHFESWRRFRLVGKALLAQRRSEWALAIFREAVRCLPHEFEAWRITAELERKLGRPQLAYETLVEGRSCFRSALELDQAIALLELAREIEPWDPDVVVDLAQLISRTGQLSSSLDLLEDLAIHGGPAAVRAARAAQVRITWSPHHVWQWLTALVPALGGASGDSARSSGEALSLFEVPSGR